MSHESYSPELITPVAQELSLATDRLYGVLDVVDDDFKFLGQDPAEVSSHEYWSAVARESHNEAARELSTPQQIGTGKALEILGTAPLFYVAHSALRESDNLPHRKRNMQDVHEMLDVLSAFNRLIVDYALTKKSLSTNELQLRITHVIEHIAQIPAEKAEYPIRSLINGMQSEVAHTILVSSMGNYRQATLEQDQNGYDGVLLAGDGLGIALNPKASQHAVGKALQLPPTTTWGIDDHGVLVFSLFDSDELHGDFHPSDELLAQKQPLLRTILNEADASGKLKLVKF